MTVLVTGLLGATATWMFRDSDDAGSGAPENEPPLTWVVKQEHLGCPFFVVEGSYEDVPKLPSNPEKLATWASQVGARSANTVTVRLTLQGTSDAVVVLDSLTAAIDGTPRVEGGVYSVELCPVPTVAPIRGFEAELNPRDSTIPLSPRRVADFPYRISLAEPEVFRIVVDPGSCTCDWTLQLAWTSGGKSGTVTIDDRGEPFRSASKQGRVQYMYESSAKSWVENPFA